LEVLGREDPRDRVERRLDDHEDAGPALARLGERVPDLLEPRPLRAEELPHAALVLGELLQELVHGPPDQVRMRSMMRAGGPPGRGGGSTPRPPAASTASRPTTTLSL